MAYYYKVKPSKARKCYLRQKDGFANWDQSAHAQEYLVYPENVSARIAIDEYSLSIGELYTSAPETPRAVKANLSPRWLAHDLKRLPRYFSIFQNTNEIKSRM